MALGDPGGNFAGTGGYGGNFGGYGGASNQSNSGGYGGTGGWGGQFGPGGYTSGLSGNQGRNTNSGTANKNSAGQSAYSPMTKKKTTQTTGLITGNLGAPSPNVQTVDPLQQEIYNMPEYQGIATKPTRGPAVTGGGGGGGGGIPGGPNSNGGNGWARGGVIQPGEHGWVGENGPEYAFGLKNGGVQITPNHMIGRLVGALSGRR